LPAAWSAPKHIPQLDGLRGLAALFVLVHHYFTGIWEPPDKSVAAGVLQVIQPFLVSGVDLFFVLSGFLIGGILLDHKGSSNFFSTFYIRRVCRIFPVAYLLLGSFVLILLSGIPQRIAGSEWLFDKPMPLWSYATFTQNIFQGFRNDIGAHWMGITWSLAVEEQFYLLFPLIVFLVPRRYLWWVTCAALPVALVLRAMAFAQYGFYASYVWLPCRMDTLMMGVIVAQLVRSDRAVTFFRQHRRAVYTVLITLVLLLQVDSVFKIFFFPTQTSAIAFAYAMVIWVSVLDPNMFLSRLFKSKFLVFSGLISYAMYMYHQGTNGTLHMLIFNDEPRITNWSTFGVTCLSVAIVFVLSYISQIFLERPIRTWGRKFKYRTKSQSTALADNTRPATEAPARADEGGPDATSGSSLATS
jgi:peptidoglycan/LPS O-acetylase OafA/YrhL